MYSHVRYVKIRRYIDQVVSLRYHTIVRYPGVEKFKETVLIINITKEGTLYYKPEKSYPNLRCISTTNILRITVLPELDQVIWKLENT